MMEHDTANKALRLPSDRFSGLWQRMRETAQKARLRLSGRFSELLQHAREKADEARRRLSDRIRRLPQQARKIAGDFHLWLSARLIRLWWWTRKTAKKAFQRLAVRMSELPTHARHIAGVSRLWITARAADLRQWAAKTAKKARDNFSPWINRQWQSLRKTAKKARQRFSPWMKDFLRRASEIAKKALRGAAAALRKLLRRIRIGAYKACKRLSAWLDERRSKRNSPGPARRRLLPIWIVELLRHMRKTAASFVALAVIIAVCVAIVLGTDFSGRAMSQQAAFYFDEYKLRDFEIVSRLGLTKDDVAELQRQEWVSVAEGCYNTVATAAVDSRQLLLTVISRTRQIDLCQAMEGSLPEAVNEIAIEEKMAESAGLTVGDRLTLDGRNAAGDSLLVRNDYVISGIVRSAAYINSFSTDMRGVSDLGNGAPAFYVLVNPEAFDHHQLDDCYTRILLTAAPLDDKSVYSDAYWDAQYDIKKELNRVAEQRSQLRYDSIAGDAEAQLEAARLEIADYEQQLADAERQLQDGEREVSAAEAQIVAGEQQISSAKSTLHSAQAQINANEQQLAAAQQQLSDSRFTLDNYQAQSEAGQRQIAEAEQELQQARQQLQDANIAIQVAQGQIDMAKEQFELYDYYLDVAESAMTSQLSIAGFSINPVEAIVEIEAALTEIGRDPQLLHTLVNLINEFYAAKDQLDEKQRDLDDAEEELEEAQELYAEQLEKFQEAESELTAAKAQLSGASSELAAGELEYKLGASQVSSGQQELAAAKREVSQGWSQVYSSTQELEEGRAQLESSKQQLAEGQIEVAEGRAQLEEARAQLAEAEAQFAQIIEEGWDIQDMDANIGYASMKTSSANIRGLRFSFALVFIIVALMVCYTSIGRMVTERRELIGAQKAQGLTKWEIMRQFFAYSGLSALLGTIIGCLASVFIVQKVAVKGYSSIYVFDKYDYYFGWGTALLVLLAVLAITALLTWLACHRQIREDATDLLRGQKPPQSKTLFFEKWPGWQQRSLYTRLIVKNLLNDKRRVLTTVVGLAGCTALLVICFMLRLAIVGAMDKQYEDIYSFDQRMVTDQREGAGPIDAIAQRLDKAADEGVEYIQVSDKLQYFRGPDSGWSFGHIICGDDLDNFNEYITLRDEESRELMSVPFSGVLISSQAAEVHGWQKGDGLQLMDSQGQTYVVTIAGVFENYAFHLLVMSGDYYRAVIGEEPVPNTFYINGASEALMAELQTMDAYMGHDSGKVEQMFEGSIMLVVVLLILSAVMAAMVLLDLNFMFIKTNTRQLAVMRVNGYTIAQTKAYIYRDNIILTVFGLLAGLGLGIWLSSDIIMCIEEEYMRFIREPIWLANFLALLINAIFMLVINLITLRKIDKLNLYSVSSN